MEGDGRRWREMEGEEGGGGYGELLAGPLREVDEVVDVEEGDHLRNRRT